MAWDFKDKDGNWIGNAAGRPPGPNKKTAEIKQAYIDLVNNNLENIESWLAQTASKDPARALDFLLKISPFIIPRLTQNDITSDGSPINIVMPTPPKKDKKNKKDNAE